MATYIYCKKVNGVSITSIRTFEADSDSNAVKILSHFIEVVDELNYEDPEWTRVTTQYVDWNACAISVYLYKLTSHLKPKLIKFNIVHENGKIRLIL